MFQVINWRYNWKWRQQWLFELICAIRCNGKKIRGGRNCKTENRPMSDQGRRRQALLEQTLLPKVSKLYFRERETLTAPYVPRQYRLLFCRLNKNRTPPLSHSVIPQTSTCRSPPPPPPPPSSCDIARIRFPSCCGSAKSTARSSSDWIY